MNQNQEMKMQLLKAFAVTDCPKTVDFCREAYKFLTEEDEPTNVRVGHLVEKPANPVAGFESFDDIKRAIINGTVDSPFALARELNNLYIRCYCADSLSEKDMELLEYYSAAIITITTVNRRILEDKRVVAFQSASFEAIDLGLPSGRKWANMNVGAESDEEPGMYFDFDEANALEFEDGWHMPSKEDFKELDENCDHEFCEINGIKGMKFTSKINNKFVFFPAAGRYSGTSLYDRGSYGCYWSSSYNRSSNAYYLYFSSSSVYPQYYFNRYDGFSVRAVQ
jgi:uncharacterized protein (TIGR02145 family)